MLMLALARSRVVVLVICVVLLPDGLLAQAPSVYYIYDELNRLVGVVDQQGSAATYAYDAVGNIVSIERFDAGGIPGAVAITMFAPSSGRAGTTVQVFGRGFAATVAQNSLSIGGRPAALVAAAPTRLVATVPAGAQTGPISVTTPLGSATSARPFRVLGELTVTPETVMVRALGHVAFTASESGVPTTNVRWAVNGLTGGDPATGTISADGVYTAPATVPVPPVVTITTTHRDDAGLSASAAVTLVPPLLVLASSRPVSIAQAAPLVISGSVGAAPVSVASAAPLVLNGSVGSALAVAVAPPNGATLASSAPLSVELEPVVLGVTPSVGTPGATLSLTVSGRGLAGATSLLFLHDGRIDPAITVTNLTADADGTRATADVTIGAGATPGGRVVQITTPAHASSPAATGGNVFTLQ